MLRKEWQAHPYHLVTQSPWPLLTSVSLLILTLSGAGWFNGFSLAGYGVALGLVSTISSMILWFKDVINERVMMGDHTILVQKGLELGFLLFLVSEIFLFVSIFWAFLHSALAPSVEIGMQWPPVGIDPLDPYSIPLLNTIILLSSGATVTYGHHALIAGDRKGAILGLILTILLALVFTSFQVVEYKEAGFTISDSVFGSVFFLGTGVHGLHIVIGTLFLTVGLVRLINYHFTSHHHVGLESAILYYHLVDVVWLALYVLFYWWGA